MFGFSSFSEAPFSSQAGNAYTLNCSAGAYTLTGSSASFSYVRKTFGNVGSYSIVGKNAAFLYDKAIKANAGSYSLTGNDARLDYDQVLTASGGSYTITGNSASFATGKSLVAGAFSFLWTGNAAQLVKSNVLNCEAGSFSFVGSSVVFQKGKTVSGSPGSYNINGQNADLVYVPNQAIVEPRGGLPKKKRKTKIDTDREQREELEAIVKREFDILDGTYVPEAVEAVKQQILPQIKEVDWTEYNIALAQVNALLLQAKIQVAEYESELDDEEALLMLL